LALERDSRVFGSIALDAHVFVLPVPLFDLLGALHDVSIEAYSAAGLGVLKPPERVDEVVGGDRIAVRPTASSRILKV
jgi:hypothetical protein